MSRWSVACFLLLTPFAIAQDSTGKPVLELWDAAYLDGSRAGYVHTITREVEQDNLKVLKTTVELRLKLKRNAEVIQIGMDTGSTETRDGRVIGVFMRQLLGQKQAVSITGEVVGDQLRLTLNGAKPLPPAPWGIRFARFL